MWTKVFTHQLKKILGHNHFSVSSFDKEARVYLMNQSGQSKVLADFKNNEVINYTYAHEDQKKKCVVL